MMLLLLLLSRSILRHCLSAVPCHDIAGDRSAGVQGPKIDASSGSSCSSSVCSDVGLLKDGAALMVGSHQPRRPAKPAKGQAPTSQHPRGQRSGSGVFYST